MREIGRLVDECVRKWIHRSTGLVQRMGVPLWRKVTASTGTTWTWVHLHQLFLIQRAHVPGIQRIFFNDKHLQSIFPTRCAQTTHFLTKSKKAHFLTKSMINCLAANYKPYQTIFWKETLVSGDGNYQAKDKSKTILCSSPLELAVHPGSPRG